MRTSRTIAWLVDHIHWFIATALFVVPFFWLPPGSMDLGGDSSRLYFYDPIAYIRHVVLYGVVPVGQGDVEPNYYYIPFVALLAVLKAIFGSPWAVITLLNAIKVSVGFLFTYFVLYELISEKRKQLAAVTGGLIYIFSNVSPYLSVAWNRALTSHNQIFLNPIMFYLLLKFILTKQLAFMWIAVLISFVFSANFAITSGPAFFSFYPISIAFLLLYARFFLKTDIPWKKLVLGLLVFLGIHAFQLLPQMMSMLEPGSFTNTKVLSNDVAYFNATYGLGKVSLGLMMPWIPAIVLIAYFFHVKNRTLYLVSFFFFVLLFLTTANVTDIGVQIYRKLFAIPGFSMFRVFYERWALVLAFYYSMLFGLSVSSLIALRNKMGAVFVWVVLMLLVVQGLPLLRGKLVNVTHWGAPEASVVWKMDHKYEETLDFIRSLPGEGKILTLPLTDAFHQVLYGTNDGAYVGTTTIGQLTGKPDFSGYQLLYPYPEDIRQFSKDKNYTALTQTYSLLGIRYVFHNSDSRIYDFPFDEFPNSYMKTAMPSKQADYVDYLSHLPVEKIYENGPYALYEFDPSVVRPLVYVADSIVTATPAALYQSSYRSAYGDASLCAVAHALCESSYKAPDIAITARMITPSEYRISVNGYKPEGAWLLVFLNKFHRNWKLIKSDGSTVLESKHVEVNGYANAWVMDPAQRNGESTVFTLMMTGERYFWIGSVVSIASVALVLIMLGRSLRKNQTW